MSCLYHEFDLSVLDYCKVVVDGYLIDDTDLDGVQSLTILVFRDLDKDLNTILCFLLHEYLIYAMRFRGLLCMPLRIL